MLTYSQLIIEENFITDKISDINKTIGKKFKKLLEKFNIFKSNLPKKLKDHGISYDKIKERIKEDVKNAKYVNGKITNFKSQLNKFINDFKEHKFSDSSGTDLLTKVILSLLGVIIIFYINTYFVSFLIASGYSSASASAIGAIFCAPLTEETAKMISIKSDSKGTFFAVFNGAEFFMYFVRMMNMGVELPIIIISRLLAVLMHWITTEVQHEEVKKGNDLTGLGKGMLIHGLWNTLAMLAK